MKNLFFRTLPILAFFFVFFNQVEAQDASCIGKDTELKRFDEDGNKKISIKELKKFLENRFEIPLNKETDKDPDDGKIDDVFTLAYIDDMKRIFGGGIEYTCEQVRLKYPSPNENHFFNMPILIRETSEDVSPYEGAKSHQKAKPAILSFGRDFFKNSNTWIAKGAVMYRTKPLKNYNKLFIFPSITFNRVLISDTSQANKQANSLILRIGAHRTFESSNTVSSLPVHVLRVYLNYATDFSFNSKQSGLELEWEPIFRIKGFGNFYTIIPSKSFDKNSRRFDQPSRFEVRIALYSRAETGYVFEVGDKENLNKDEGFLRAGGKIGLDLRFYEKLLLSGFKTYLKGFTGTPKESQLTNLSASYLLGDEGQFGLKLEYQKGNVPLTQEEVENIIFGLAIKL